MQTDPKNAQKPHGEGGVALSPIVRAACIICRLMALAIASVFLLPFIGIAGLWGEWKSEIKMIRDGY